MKPQDIEKRSFEIITAELGERTFPAGIAEVVKRVIHTTADFDYADSLAFSPDVISRAKAALAAGATVVTDTNMALSGVSKATLACRACARHRCAGRICQRGRGEGAVHRRGHAVYHRARPQGRLECSRVHCQCAALSDGTSRRLLIAVAKPRFGRQEERTVGRSKVVRKFLYRNFLPPEVKKA